MSLDRATIITLGSVLPPAIGIFGRLEMLLQKPDTDLEQIVDLVRVDPALTFQIIRLGNSAFYGLAQRCDSLEEAVARIGFRDIHSLVGLVAARHTCQKELAAYGVPAQRFWENAVATGQIMAALALRNGSDARATYATGLLRNLGRIVLNNYAGAVRYPGPALAGPLAEWEQATYQLSAAEVGAVLLEHWRFSPGTVAAVRTHGAPVAGAEAALPAAMLQLAAAQADEWGHGLPGERSLWLDGRAMMDLAGLTEEECGRAVAEAHEIFLRIANLKWAQAA
jgi:HD-like signal output (HDOD) protein